MHKKFLRLAVAFAALLSWLPADAATPSGLPLPRFVTTRSTPINVRVGPGTKYDVYWVFKVAGAPVEIIQEFDVWRKIRDIDDTEGWVHQALLSGDRAAYVSPSNALEHAGLRAAARDDAAIVAWLGVNFRVGIENCQAGWCQVVAIDHRAGQRPVAFKGFLPQADLWGVYPGEDVN